jgi:hypothetical protein
MELAGWHADPFGTHEERFFKDGAPTPLVRDDGIGSYSEPPVAAAPPVPAHGAPQAVTLPTPTPAGPDSLFVSAPPQHRLVPPPPPPAAPARALSVVRQAPETAVAVGDVHDPAAREMLDVMERLNLLQERIVLFNKNGGTLQQRAALLAERDRLFAERERLKAQRVAATSPTLRTTAAS